MSFEVNYVVNDVNTKSKMQYLVLNKSNIGSFPASTYEKRSTSVDILNFPHSINLDGSPLGCFEQSISIQHNYDVSVKVSVYPSFYDTSIKWLYGIPPITIGKSSGSQQRLTLSPEVSNDATGGSSSNTIKEISELRQPIPIIQIRLEYPEGAPTTGELQIVITRRF